MTSERMNPARQIIERSRAAGRLADVRVLLLSIMLRSKIEPDVMRVRRFQSATLKRGDIVAIGPRSGRVLALEYFAGASGRPIGRCAGKSPNTFAEPVLNSSAKIAGLSEQQQASFELLA